MEQPKQLGHSEQKEIKVPNQIPKSKLDSFFLNYVLPHRTHAETIRCTYSRKLLLVKVEHPDKDTAFLWHSIFL